MLAKINSISKANSQDVLKYFDICINRTKRINFTNKICEYKNIYMCLMQMLVHYTAEVSQGHRKCYRCWKKSSNVLLLCVFF